MRAAELSSDLLSVSGADALRAARSGLHVDEQHVVPLMALRRRARGKGGPGEETVCGNQRAPNPPHGH